MGAQFINGQRNAFASAREMEHVDIGTADHQVTINGGVAMAVYCDTAGEILTIDNTMLTGYTTLALMEGWNAIEVTKIYQTGSTISGNVDVGAW